MFLNKILLRIAADNKKDESDDNFEFDFDSLFNDLGDNNADKDDATADNNSSMDIGTTTDASPKSDIEEMITNSTIPDIDPFDPYQQSANQANSQSNKNMELVQNTFFSLANEGRGVLKRIEDYKFKIIQSINMLNGNPELKEKVEQKKKILESAAAQIYGMIFDLENFDLTPNYEEEQLAGESFPTVDLPPDEGFDLNENAEAEDADTDNTDEDVAANDGENAAGGGGREAAGAPAEMAEGAEAGGGGGDEAMMQGGFDENLNIEE